MYKFIQIYNPAAHAADASARCLTAISRYLQSNGRIPKSNKQENYMITPRTQTAIAVLKCIYARDYGTCIKPCTLTERANAGTIIATAYQCAKFILLKDAENPLETQSYIPARKAVEISLLDILEATGEHLNCNRPITEQFYVQYGRAAQKLGIINQIARIYLKEITLTDL